jgi:N-methylhydantoinase B
MSVSKMTADGAVAGGYDVVAAEVHRKALENLTNEMAITLLRTSGSPSVVEGKDFATCIMDTTPEHLAFSAYVLVHMGSSLIGTRNIVELADVDDLRPGDGWIVNDPHTAGALHQGDMAVIMPTFYRGEHLGWSFVNMHVLDIGGMGISGFAPGAHDVWQEALRFPPLRIIRDGAIDASWEQFISANVRVPGPVLNDLRSMIAANNTAAQKLVTILDEYGVERHREYCEINKDLTEQLMRERITAMPDGVYEATNWVEFDGHDGGDRLLELSLSLEVDGSDLYLSYRGAPQVDAFVNGTTGTMYGSMMSALITLLGYGDLPINGGIWRPIHVDLGESGSIVNATLPAPVSNGHGETGSHAVSLTRDVLVQAMSLSEDPVLRARVAGSSQDGFPGHSMFGVNQHGGPAVMFYQDNATGLGGGAQTMQDGQDTYGFTCMTGSGLGDVEARESYDPVVFAWRRLVPNSGGPGQTRGGQGVEQAVVLRYTDAVSGPGFNGVGRVPQPGFGGGCPPSTGGYRLLRDTNIERLLASDRLPTHERVQGTEAPLGSKVTHFPFHRNEILITTSGGGSGLGDPLLRSPEAVTSDMRDGYTTATQSEAVYGVILGEDGTVDEALTARRREQIRRERIASDPVSELQEPKSMGVSLVHSDSGWQCGHCGATIAGPAENAREGKAILRESPITDVYSTRDMDVRARSEGSPIMLREYFCPSCAGSLAVDVAIEGTPTKVAVRLKESSDDARA